MSIDANEVDSIVVVVVVRPFANVSGKAQNE